MAEVRIANPVFVRCEGTNVFWQTASQPLDGLREETLEHAIAAVDTVSLDSNDGSFGLNECLGVIKECNSYLALQAVPDARLLHAGVLKFMQLSPGMPTEIFATREVTDSLIVDSEYGENVAREYLARMLVDDPIDRQEKWIPVGATERQWLKDTCFKLGWVGSTEDFFDKPDFVDVDRGHEQTA